MRKELGKLLLDIVKYVITAVIVSDIFTDINGSELYVTASITTTILLIFGLLLVKDPTENKTQKHKPKKRK